MKSFILASLISFSATAADYTCRADMVKLELTTNADMTSLIVRDARTGEYFYNGIVTELIDRDGRTDLMFETGSHSFLQLQFKTEDFKNETDTLFGFANGWTGAGSVNRSLRCLKKSPSL